MASFRGLLFTVVCCSVVIEVCCITVEEFYTFGEGSGDSRLPRNDDGSSEPITLRTEFPFFDQIRRRVYVSTLLQVCSTHAASLPRIAVLFEHRVVRASSKGMTHANCIQTWTTQRFGSESSLEEFLPKPTHVARRSNETAIRIINTKILVCADI